LIGKPEEKRPLGRPWCRWVDNIKIDLQEVRIGGMDWIELAQDRDRIFWPKRDEVTGEWRKLHNKELNDLHCSPNIVWVKNREE